MDKVSFLVVLGSVLASAVQCISSSVPQPVVLTEFVKSEESPRNSEGDVVKLRDGRLLVVYSHFYKDPASPYAGGGHDHASAELALTESSDGGKTWSPRRTVVRKGEGTLNVMSASFLRLGDGRLALFYLVKATERDCRPALIVSSDEGKSWSAPRLCVGESDKGYYVLNNARALRLENGRILLPLAKHGNYFRNDRWWSTEAAELLCAISDDEGRTWRLSDDRRKGGTEDGKEVCLQEPGLVEMKDGRLMMYARSNLRRQYKLFSADGGDHWTEPEPIAEYATTCYSPVTYVRLKSGELVVAFNDVAAHPADEQPKAYERRWPLVLAVSSDEGKTWRKKTLEADNADKDLHCCYMAVREIDGRLVMVYCQREALCTTRVMSVPLEWLPTAKADVPLPTMGWSSWNTYRVNISEDLIKRQAKALVDGGFAAAGYRYVNIDDGWFGGRDKDGRQTTNPARFPNGLKPVADYIHSLGLKAGIYSDAGENTCGSIWDNDKLGIGVGFSGHDAEDADWYFDEMGFDFIKIDFGGGIPKGNRAGVYFNERERYTAIAREIARVQKKVGREIRMNVCCWRFPGEWVSDIAGSWRIGPDLGVIFESVKAQIDKCSYLGRFQKPGHYNDMDMLQVGRGRMNEEEDRTHFGMWCMMSSPLLIGCDLTTIKPETAALLKNTDLIALNQDPLGKQAEVYSRHWKHDWRVYVKPLAPAGSMNKAIALYNGTDEEQEITAELDAMGYDWNEVAVWDCYEHRQMPNAKKSIVQKVPAHGTRIYRLALAETKGR